MATNMQEAKKELAALCAVLHMKYVLTDGMTEEQANIAVTDAIDFFKMGVAAQADFPEE